ncbi:hypothetical protein Y1Q_0022228 [Alligator mississippiensis]|uniref:Uncharacterized protein n=1 Tax=Alligator mississippiensis TaxID=8496 RepID=A0A151NZR3_ALLMI|nr:hypothetical protein Y1Q_0022228 [Alligator mississippiensis]
MCGLGTGSTDWHLCSLRFSSWISSSLSDRRCSSSRILSSFSSSSLAKSPSSSLMVPGCSSAAHFKHAKLKPQSSNLSPYFWKCQ